MDNPKKGDVIQVANWGLRRDRANLCFIGSLTMGSTTRAGVLGMIPPLKNQKNQKLHVGRRHEGKHVDAFVNPEQIFKMQWYKCVGMILK